MKRNHLMQVTKCGNQKQMLGVWLVIVACKQSAAIACVCACSPKSHDICLLCALCN